MKVKLLSRSSSEHTRERITDLQKIKRNFDPELHPFEKAREYTRAVRAAKLERMFAKPFIGALSGHIDGVYSLAKNPYNLDLMYSGSGDGEVRVWSLSNQESLWKCGQAHNGMVSGLTVIPESNASAGSIGFGKRFISVGTDKMVKLWSINKTGSDASRLLATPKSGSSLLPENKGKRLAEMYNESIKNDIEMNDELSARYATNSVELEDFSSYGKDDPVPISVYTGKEAFLSVDHHRSKSWFATSSSVVSIWDIERSEPISNFSWGSDTINTVRFNQTETNILASSGTDRNVILYDLRTSTPVAKLVMALKTNAIAWNPMEAFIFTCGNEDHNCYTFDMRKMDMALNIMKDHVSAVMDVDYSPTGMELVTASYDKSIRIFNTKNGHSRDIYHTKRMQKVFAAKFTLDNKFVVSGSDDGNLRLWRAVSSDRVGIKSNRERNNLEYLEKVKKRYKHMPEVGKVLRTRNLPRDIKKTSKVKREMLDARKQKEENLRKNSKPGTVPIVPERKKSILQVTSK
ncbi:hypothetical protein BB559_007257 [Furculomyces boomerangus]|uniref:Uncharacterized protein n=2 Tax=Harpellales TaxID=61421 RepID=A0A2T9XY49_9FUNG|nr:hypothetical protein BB559_007257 [Furculomyces boomerangus]PVZ96645.1 hypothetical protein BB558_007434 [Smittium angustum]